MIRRPQQAAHLLLWSRESPFASCRCASCMGVIAMMNICSMGVITARTVARPFVVELID